VKHARHLERWLAVMRPVVVAVLVVGVVLFPLLRADQARAQAPPIQAGLVAACGSNPACIAVVGAGAVAACWYMYEQTGSACAVDQVDDFVDALVDWWDAGGSEVDNMAAQYSSHPNYIVPTQDTFDEWWDFFGSLADTGWTFESDYLGLGADAFTFVADGTSRQLVSPPITIPSTVNAWHFDFQYNKLVGPNADYLNEYRLNMVNCSTLAVSSSITTATTGSGGSAAWSGAGKINMGLGAWTDLAAGGGPHCLRVDMPSAGAASGDNGDTGALRAIAGFGVYFDYLSGTDVEYWFDAPDFSVVAALAVPSASGERVMVPAAVDDLEGYENTSDLPLAAGGTGLGVQAGEGTGTGTGTLVDEDERPWWEGLFGGLRGALNTGNNILQNIYNTVTDIAEGIAALPVTIADLFNPAIGWADFLSNTYPGIQDDALAVAPGCYVAAVTDGELFTGDSEPLMVELGGVGGNAATEIEVLPYQSGVASVTQPLFATMCGAVLFFWAVKRVANPIPDGTQLRLDI